MEGKVVPACPTFYRYYRYPRGLWVLPVNLHLTFPIVCVCVCGAIRWQWRARRGDGSDERTEGPHPDVMGDRLYYEGKVWSWTICKVSLYVTTFKKFSIWSIIWYVIPNACAWRQIPAQRDSLFRSDAQQPCVILHKVHTVFREPATVRSAYDLSFSPWSLFKVSLVPIFPVQLDSLTTAKIP